MSGTVAARTILDRRERDNWELGQVAAMAWALCGNAERAAAEGYAGDNQKERFGKWVSVNFTDTPQSSLYKARALCEDAERAAAEGYAGDNPDERFGKWVSVNFTDTNIRTLIDYRRLWETFGHRREEVAHIPQFQRHRVCNSHRKMGKFAH